jgi:hypothetical protein
LFHLRLDGGDWPDQRHRYTAVAHLTFTGLNGTGVI